MKTTLPRLRSRLPFNPAGPRHLPDGAAGRWLARRAALALMVCGLPLLAGAESLVYQGLTNSSVGGASLMVLGSQLVVTNLGSGGQDGLAIALPVNATALDVGWEQLDPSNTLPVGAYVQSQLVGPANGVNNSVLGTLTETKTGTSNYVVSADYSPVGATTYTVRAYYHEVLVAEATHQSGSSLAVLKNFSVTKDIDMPSTSSCDAGHNGVTAFIGTTMVTCDHLYVTPENPQVPLAPTAFQLVASQVPSLTIDGENITVLYAGLHVTTLGNATLTVSSNQCTVANIGDSGQDGAVIKDTKNIADAAAKNQAEDVEVRMNPPDNNGALPVGAYMSEQLIGTDNGITNDVLGTLTVSKAGTGIYDITSDFSPTGQSAYEVDDSSNSMQLESFQWGAAEGIISAGDTFPPILGFGFANASNTPGLLLDWGTNAVTLSGHGTNVECNHLSVTPDNVSLPGAPTGFQITASQVPSFTIAAVAVSPLLVSASLTNDNLMLQWYGTAGVQESADLATWTDDTNATSPYAAAKPKNGGSTVEPLHFYRLVFRP